MPSDPHQHQAGKLCLDKPTLMFMIGRRLKARSDGWTGGSRQLCLQSDPGGQLASAGANGEGAPPPGAGGSLQTSPQDAGGVKTCAELPAWHLGLAVLGSQGLR